MDIKSFLQSIGEVIDAKDASKFASFISENGIFKFGNAEAVKGRKEIENYVSNFFSMIGGSEHEIINFWEKPGSIVWQGAVTYTRLDGKKVKVDFTNIFYMRDDLIEQYLIYIDNSPLFS